MRIEHCHQASQLGVPTPAHRAGSRGRPPCGLGGGLRALGPTRFEPRNPEPRPGAREADRSGEHPFLPGGADRPPTPPLAPSPPGPAGPGASRQGAGEAAWLGAMVTGVPEGRGVPHHPSRLGHRTLPGPGCPRPLRCGPAPGAQQQRLPSCPGPRQPHPPPAARLPTPLPATSPPLLRLERLLSVAENASAAQLHASAA